MANKQNPIDIETDVPLLRSFEDLGALSEAYGVYKIKPFRDWKGSSWKNHIFGIRLCNAGQLLDIATFCNDFVETSRTQTTKLELLLESIISIEGRSLLTPEELEKHNNLHRTSLTSREFLRAWIRNLEQVVVDRLDNIYGGLQLKQDRVLRGEMLCEGCGKIFPELPEAGVYLQYSLGEILCKDCNIPEIQKDFDIVLPVPTTLEKESTLTPTPTPGTEGFSSFGSGGQICPDCQQEFDTVEELSKHRPECPKAGSV